MTAIIDLLKYFSKFVPKAVLQEMFVQPEDMQEQGYSELTSEILAEPDTLRIAGIKKYICSSNPTFVLDSVRDSEDFTLFVEYNSVSFDPTATDGVSQKLAVTICKAVSISNNDNVNEILVMNDCLAKLQTILTQMSKDQRSISACGLEDLIHFPADIIPIDPAQFSNRSGWTALFTNIKSFCE